MEKNIELMDRALGAIEANPAEHLQGTWRCDSGMCMAGWAAHLEGAVWKHEKPLPGFQNWENGLVITSEGKEEHVSEYARKLFGLDTTEASYLFGSSNNLNSLKKMVKVFANNEDTEQLECILEARFEEMEAEEDA